MGNMTIDDLKKMGYHIKDGKAVKVPSGDKPNKMGAVKTVVNGVKFDSKREANRAGKLQYMQQTGLISDLKFQVPFLLASEKTLEGAKARGLGKIAIPKYYADFTYTMNGKYVVEDSKGFKTAIYNIKKRFMKLIYDIDIYET
jgi:hypothetical protein